MIVNVHRLPKQLSSLTLSNLLVWGLLLQILLLLISLASALCLHAIQFSGTL